MKDERTDRELLESINSKVNALIGFIVGLVIYGGLVMILNHL